MKGRSDTLDMPPEDFRAAAHQIADWVADYLKEVEGHPVLARTNPGEIRAGLPEAAPEQGEPFADLLKDVDARILPGITHWNHPSFHGYFAVTGSGPGILAETIAAALNVNAMVWRSSPAATELEEHVLDWLRDAMGLPSGMTGVVNDTASMSTLHALAAAREEGLPEAREDGLAAAPRGRIYASREAHSSVDKAAIALGLGRKGVVRVEADADFRMDPVALDQAIRADSDAGVRPLAIVATVGTTSTSSVDPVAEVADVAQAHGLWLHVDAAYAGSAALVPEHRHHFKGWERADSVVFNPHKWLFTPVDCSVLFTAGGERIRAAFQLVPEYLRTGEDDRVTNLMDHGVALGRRFRALKLWFVLRYFGLEGIRGAIREHIRMAQDVAGWVDEDPHAVRVAPVPFSTVVFRFEPPVVPQQDGESRTEALDRLNLQAMEAVNRSGTAFLSHTRLDGRVALRLSIGNLRTRPRHLEATWEALRTAVWEMAEAA